MAINVVSDIDFDSFSSSCEKSHSYRLNYDTAMVAKGMTPSKEYEGNRLLDSSKSSSVVAINSLSRAPPLAGRTSSRDSGWVVWENEHTNTTIDYTQRRSNSEYFLTNDDRCPRIAISAGQTVSIFSPTTTVALE